MKAYLAGTSNHRELLGEFERSPAILEAYPSFNDWQAPLTKGRDFLLDSGAFTFLSRGHGPNDIEGFVDGYIAFIQDRRIDHFFELDIDAIIGQDRVDAIRRRIEMDTGRDCIPVWHVTRGIEEFKRLCKRYDRVAIGGFVSGEFPVSHYRAIPSLLAAAHADGAKVHGLGFTRFRDLPHYHFDSVDSTSWMWGRYGYYFTFEGGIMKMERGHTHKMRATKSLSAYNLDVWIRFQRWAGVNL